MKIHNTNIQHSKRELGQYLTKRNPFSYQAFNEWLSIIPCETSVFLEPFAGKGYIPDMINSIGTNAKWVCYDIDECSAQQSRANGYTTYHQDTLTNFPKGYSVVITNPPYLAKNSATNRKIKYPDTHYDDVYKMALDNMLSNVDFVAAIVPESFLTQNLFHERLYSVVSIPERLFDDTECPVCLAMFSPLSIAAGGDFPVYSGNNFLGTYKNLMWNMKTTKICKNWMFNDKNGILGFYAIDNNQCASIHFTRGEYIESDKIKNTSRSITRISNPYLDFQNVEAFIKCVNELVYEYRNTTKDVFMSPFKGLRADGFYRRRMDFNTARMLLNESFHSFNMK